VNVANNPFKDVLKILVDTPLGKVLQRPEHLVGGRRPVDEFGKRAPDTQLLQRAAVLAYHVGGAVASVEDVTDTRERMNHTVDLREDRVVAVGFGLAALSEPPFQPGPNPRVGPQIGVEHIAAVGDVRSE